jgi:ATP-dependent DNA helicase RecQ
LVTRFSGLAALDLEVCPETSRIKAIGAVRPDRDGHFKWEGSNPNEGVSRLVDYIHGSSLVVGHNLENFDLAHITVANPNTGIEQLPHIDTLWLSALAWPEPRTLRLKKIGREGQLGAATPNDPVTDAAASLALFREAVDALTGVWTAAPELAQAVHGSTADLPALARGQVFSILRGRPQPTPSERDHSIQILAKGRVCESQAEYLIELAHDGDSALPFILARIASDRPGAGLSPWVRRRFPKAQEALERLRGRTCDSSDCEWCREHRDSRRALKRWFGYDSFRPAPSTNDGLPMQQAIIDAVNDHRDVLGILPTGTGKSVCYQLPALERHAVLDSLTVVISPLVALMADQRDGLLKNHSIDTCVVVNGTLSPLHRQEALDQVIYGDASILLIAPEQLRNTAIRQALDSRKIGLWVFDEAHCISKWGHDFRPDYRYAVRCLSKINGDDDAPQVLCVTATAKKSVVADIGEQIAEATGREMLLFDGGAARTNLSFDAAPVNRLSKLGAVSEAIKASGSDGASLVYCATRSETERQAEALKAVPLPAAAYHAGLGRELRQSILEDYLDGHLTAIAATNAFGMGVDKPDIRLVVHADVPGSLENYLQEAGRAGRDGDSAMCRLFFDPAQIEAHFRRQAENRLSRREVARVLKTLREMAQKFAKDSELIVHIDDLLRRAGIPAGHDGAGRTRVITAIAWLEEAGLLTRGANRVTVEPSCLRVKTVQEADRELRANGVSGPRLKTAVALLAVLLEAAPNDSFTIEDLADLISRTGWQVRELLRDLDRVGIIARDTNLVVYIAHGVKNSASERLVAISALERTLLEALEPDLSAAPPSGVVINLRRLAQDLRDRGHYGHRPDQLVRLLRSLSKDGRRDIDESPPISVRPIDRERVHITLHGDVEALRQAAERRHSVSSLIVSELESRLEKGARGSALPVPVPLTELYDLLQQDMEMRSLVSELGTRVVDRALLWMHALDVLFVGSGLFLFAPAVTVQLSSDTRTFTEADFRPLADHYTELTRQVHIMSRYGELALDDVHEAQDLVKEYFSTETEPFLSRWLPDMKRSETERPIQPALYGQIVDDLKAPDQIEIVADDRQESNVLVLAGPGSGKTRVLVHRIAYLLSVRREDPAGIIALAYNQHAAHEIRTRLRELVGESARGVTVRTCHGLALWLTGRSLVGERPQGEDFRAILREAVRIMQTDVEAKESLLEGYRWILVDEYQDIGPDEYELISAIAGLARSDPDNRRTLFAVGDDDQAIYGFNGASVKFIRRFSEDFRARPTYLTRNYRSTKHIITASNAVIGPASDRMKVEHPIEIDRKRQDLPPGGGLSKSDPVGRGRVQILTGTESARDQALAAVAELKRVAGIIDGWSWGNAAVIARTWAALDPVRSFCEAEGIPVCDRRETRDRPNLWQLLEYRQLSQWLVSQDSPMVSIDAMRNWLVEGKQGPIWRSLGDLAGRMEDDLGVGEVSAKDALAWIGDWGREYGVAGSGLTLVTAHSAKGLEFDHVVVLDDAWKPRANDNPDEQRRLFYVAMTRARQSLCLLEGNSPHPFLPKENVDQAFIRRPAAVPQVAAEATERLYRTASLREVNIGFGGRLAEGTGWYRALQAAQTGDSIQLTPNQNGRWQGWQLRNQKGGVVGTMAKAFNPPDGFVCDQARIAWLVARRQDQSQPGDYAAPLHEEWPVVVPEFVFRPEKRDAA